MLSCEIFNILGHSHIIPAYRWVNTKKETKAALLIVHGMAEHATRYNEFAEYLVTQSIAVYSFDLRGHGECTKNSAEGFFAKKDGDKLVLSDIEAVFTEIKFETPGLPVFILGHSMGSIFTEAFISEGDIKPDGVILSGVAVTNDLQRYLGYFLSSLLCMLGNAEKKSPLMTLLSFGAFNKAFEPTKTAFDWISRDEKEVAAYIANPWCGFVCTASLFRDMLKTLNKISKINTLKKIVKTIPIMIIAGERDPVGNMGKGAIQIKQMLEDVDINKVILKLYEGARHEVLNEINKEEVYSDVAGFIECCLSEQ